MFYVYVYRDPRPSKNNQPVYVGKGTGARDLSHWSRGSHNKPFQDFISHLKQRGLVSLPERVFETESEAAAFAKEVDLILLYGRRNIKKGTLFNLTDGGEGGSGTVRTAAHKAADSRFSKAHWQQPEYRTKVVAAQQAAQSTPEARAAKAEASTTTWKTPAVRAARTAGIATARATKQSKAKTSEQAKAQWSDPAYAARQTANNKEIANRPEVRAAKSAAAKAQWADPAFRAGMKERKEAKKSNKLLAQHTAS